DRDNRVVDEKLGHGYLPASATGASPPALIGGAGFALTVAPSFTRCRPSTMTFSPGLRPSSITHRLSTRGPTLTFRNVTLLSLPTTAMLYRFCSSWTAR